MIIEQFADNSPQFLAEKIVAVAPFDLRPSTFDREVTK